MKRDKQGRVHFTVKGRDDRGPQRSYHYQLTEKGLRVRQGQIWMSPEWWAFCPLFDTETSRAKLAEAIAALDKPYEGINVHIPPEHRATPRGNK